MQPDYVVIPNGCNLDEDEVRKYTMKKNLKLTKEEYKSIIEGIENIMSLNEKEIYNNFQIISKSIIEKFSKKLQELEVLENNICLQENHSTDANKLKQQNLLGRKSTQGRQPIIAIPLTNKNQRNSRIGNPNTSQNGLNAQGWPNQAITGTNSGNILRSLQSVSTKKVVTGTHLPYQEIKEPVVNQNIKQRLKGL